MTDFDIFLEFIITTPWIIWVMIVIGIASFYWQYKIARKRHQEYLKNKKNKKLYEKYKP